MMEHHDNNEHNDDMSVDQEDPAAKSTIPEEFTTDLSNHQSECAILPEGHSVVLTEKPKLKVAKPKVTLEDLNKLIQNIITFVVTVLTSTIYPAIQKYEDMTVGHAESRDHADRRHPSDRRRTGDRRQLTGSQDLTHDQNLTESQIAVKRLEYAEKGVETDIIDITEMGAETELLEVSEKEVETDAIEFAEKGAETDMIESSDEETKQPTVEVSEKEIETDTIELVDEAAETESQGIGEGQDTGDSQIIGKGQGVGESEDTGESKDTGDIGQDQDVGESEDTGESKDTGDISQDQDVGESEDTGESKDTGDIGQDQDVGKGEDTGESKDIADSQVIGESGDMGESKDTGDIGQGQGVGESKDTGDGGQGQDVGKGGDTGESKDIIDSQVTGQGQDVAESGDIDKSQIIGESQDADESQLAGESEDIGDDEEVTEVEDVTEGQEPDESGESGESVESGESYSTECEDFSETENGVKIEDSEITEGATEGEATKVQETTKGPYTAKDQDTTGSAERQDVTKVQDEGPDAARGQGDIAKEQDSIEGQGLTESQITTQKQYDTKSQNLDENSDDQVSPSEASDMADEIVNDVITSVNEDPLSAPMKLLPSLNFLSQLLCKPSEKRQESTKDVLGVSRSQILPAAEKILRAHLEKLTADYPELVYILTGFHSTQKTSANSRKLIFNCKVHCLATDITNNILQKLRCIISNEVITTILNYKPAISSLHSKDNISDKNKHIHKSEKEPKNDKCDDLHLINVEQECCYSHEICLGAASEISEDTSEFQNSEIFNVIEDMNKYVSTRIETVTSAKMIPVICTDPPESPSENPEIDFSVQAKDIVITILKAIHNEVKKKAVAKLKCGSDMSLLKEAILVDEILSAILQALSGKTADDFKKLKLKKKVKSKEISERKPKAHKKAGEQAISAPKGETLPAVNIPGMVIYPQMEDGDISTIKGAPGRQKPEAGHVAQQKAKAEDSERDAKFPRRDSKIPTQHDLNEQELAYEPKDIPEGTLLEKLFKKPEETSTSDLHPERKPKGTQTIPRKCRRREKKLQTKQHKVRDKKQQTTKELKLQTSKDLKQHVGKDVKQQVEKDTKQQVEKDTKQQAEKEAKEQVEKDTKQQAEKEAKEQVEKDTKQQAEKEAKEQAEKEAKEQAEKEAKEQADKEAQEQADKEAKEQAEKEAKEQAEKEAKEQADKEAKEQAEKEAKEQAEKEAKEQAEKEAKEQAEKEAQEQAEKEAQEQAEKEAQEQAEKEAKEQAEKEAKEQAEKEAKEQAEKEAKEQAEKEAQEQAEKEAQEQAENGAKEQVEKEAKEQAEKEAQEQAEKEAQEQAEKDAKEQAEKEAQEQAEKEAQEQAEREAQEQAEREAKEQAEKEAQEQAEREAQEQAEKEAKEQAEREAQEQAEKEAQEQAEKEAKEQAEKEAKEQAEKEAKEQAEKEAKEQAEKEAKEQAEKEAKEQAEKEAQEKAEKETKEKVEKEAKEKAGKESKEQAEKEEKKQTEKDARKQTEKDMKKPTDKDMKKPEKDSKPGVDKESKSLKGKEMKSLLKTSAADKVPYQLQLSPEAIKALCQMIVGVILDRFGLSDAHEERSQQHSGKGKGDHDLIQGSHHKQFSSTDSTGKMASVKKGSVSGNLSQVDLMTSKILPPIMGASEVPAENQDKSFYAAKAIADAIASNKLHIELIWIKSPSTVAKLNKIVSSPDINLVSNDIVNKVLKMILDASNSSSRVKIDTKRPQTGLISASDIVSDLKSAKQIAATLPHGTPMFSQASLELITRVAEELVRKLLNKCLLFQGHITADSHVRIAQITDASESKPNENGPIGSTTSNSDYERLFIIIMKAITDLLGLKVQLPNENMAELTADSSLVKEKPTPTTEVSVKGKPTRLEESKLIPDDAFPKSQGSSALPQTIIKKLAKPRKLSLTKIAISPTKSLSTESQKLGNKPERLPEAIPKSKKSMTKKKTSTSKKPPINQAGDRLPVFQKVKEIKVIKDDKTEKIAVKSKPHKPLKDTHDEESAMQQLELKDDKHVREAFDEKLVKLLTTQLKCEISDMVLGQKKIDHESSLSNSSDSCLDLVSEDTTKSVMDHIKKVIGLSLHSLEQNPEINKEQLCPFKSSESSETTSDFTECFTKLFSDMASSVSQSCKLGLTSPDFLNAIYYEIKKSLTSHKELKPEPGQIANNASTAPEGKKHFKTFGDQVTNRLHEILQTKTEMLVSDAKDLKEPKTTDTARRMKEELIKFALQQLLNDEKFSQEITNIIDGERKIISSHIRHLEALITPDVLQDIILKTVNILLKQIDSTLSFIPLECEVNDVSQELVNVVVAEVERKYACEDSFEAQDSSVSDTCELYPKKTCHNNTFASTLTSLNFVSDVTKQAKKILCAKSLMQNQVVLRKPIEHQIQFSDSGTEDIASYFDLISDDLIHFILEQIQHVISCPGFVSEMQLSQSQTTSSEISIIDISSKDTSAPTICSEHSSCSSKTSKKRISFSIPQESVCQKVCSSSISSMADSMTEESSEVCYHEPGISGLTKMSETLIENVINSVLKSEQSCEEGGVCPFAKAPISVNEDMQSNLVRFILEEKKKYQCSNTIVSEHSESPFDQRAEKTVCGMTDEFDTCSFPSRTDSGEKQTCGGKPVCESQKKEAEKTCSGHKLDENINVILLPHVMKSITEYVKYSIYLSQLDQLCGTKEANKFKNDITRRELQDFFLELITKEIIQKFTECKKQASFLDKPRPQYIEKDVQVNEVEYTTPDDVSNDTVCPLTRKETIISWATMPPVCDTELYDENFMSIDGLNKVLCMEGEKALSHVSDSVLPKPVVSDRSSCTSQFSDTIISTMYQGFESSFEAPCVCSFKPSEFDVCKYPDEESSPILFSDKESVCTLSAIEPPVSRKTSSYGGTCTCPLHFEDRKLSVSSTEEHIYSTGSSEAESLVQSALCNVWAGIASEEQQTSEAQEHDKLHSVESSIALDDLSEELLTEALVSIFTQMIESLFPELSDKASESSHSSQLNLLSEKIVSDVMQELKHCSESSTSSLFIPSSSESSGKDNKQLALLKNNLKKQKSTKSQASGKISRLGKTSTIAQKFSDKKLSSSSSTTEETSSSISSDAENLVQMVLSNILSSRPHMDRQSSKTFKYEKPIQQQTAALRGNDLLSESSHSLGEALSREDLVSICSQIADTLLQKSPSLLSHRPSASQLSLISEKIVTNIIQVLESSLESAASSIHKHPVDGNAGKSKIEKNIPIEPPIRMITSDHTIISTQPKSDSYSSEETSHTTSSEAEDVLHDVFSETTISAIFGPEKEAVPVKIVPHKRETQLKVDPEIISDHLSVISIKTEPIEMLQQMSLLHTGQNLQALRKASVAHPESLVKPEKGVHVSFNKDVTSRRGSLDNYGRLDVKRKEVLARNSFTNLFNPEISKVELLKDVNDKRELIIRLVAHDVPGDREHADEDDDEDEEEESEVVENVSQDEEIIHEDVGLFDIGNEEEPLISMSTNDVRYGFAGDNFQPASLLKRDSIADKTANDLSVEKLRYNNAQHEKKQSFEAFVELLHQTGQWESTNELTIQHIKDFLRENPTNVNFHAAGNTQGRSSEGHNPHPPQGKKLWPKEFCHVHFDSAALLASLGLTDMTVLELERREAQHQSKQ
ncbi:uncharacterized protein LOC125458993 [Stegostoma tigrinum]|uniref:uncharacterized protein LOC125458993 n=1 Tax=Stegostoma tigrinum TaxID=3053191 RepID=UPI00287003AA|nr:uncharacterized protein LOC125458993 [Stegostoma tigrinum]